MSAFDSVLVIGFGGPTPDNACRCEPPCPSAAWCFIRGVLQSAMPGRPVERARIETVVRNYAELGGFSPYNERTLAQAAALEGALGERGIALPVYVGMKNWTPWLDDVLARMSREGRRRALGIIMSPFQGAASWARYVKTIVAERRRLGGIPEVVYMQGWQAEPGFVKALADLTRLELAALPGDGKTALVFTAHSIPLFLRKRGPYLAQFEETARLVARAAGAGESMLAYQSAPIPSRIPWMGPDVGELIEGLPARGFRRMLVNPLSFICDHAEVLFDLDVRARGIAEAAGLEYRRVPAVGTHPAFIGMLAGRAAAMVKT